MPSFDFRTCKIVTSRDPIPAELHAADELQRWIGNLVGRQPELVNEIDGHCIVLKVDTSMGKEECSIRPEEGNMLISGGRPRGVLYGAYELLDRFAGIRWLSTDETIIPRVKEVEIPKEGFGFWPVLSYREPYFTEAFDGDWAARNRMNSNRAGLTELHGGKIIYVGFVHTFNMLVPPEEFFSSHPEYFSEIDGERVAEKTQLCLTNSDVVRIAAERAVSWLEENPDASIVSISQNDWANPCQCPNCSRIDEEEGSHAGSLLHFVNQVAEIVEEKFPEKWVDTLAYQYTRKATRTIKPRRNVIVRLCSIECCFSHPLVTCPENASFKRDTEEWAEMAHTLYVWDYVTNFAHYIMPFPNLRVLQPNVQFFVKNNVKGIFEEGNYSQGGGGEFASLRSYLLSKILWEPDCDIKAAMGEFLSSYYGNATGAIESYIDLLHDRVEKGNIHVRIFDSPDKLLDLPFVKDSISLFDEAETKANNKKYRDRVRLARLPLVYSEIFLTDQADPMRRKLLKEFVEECRSFGITNISEGKTLDLFAEENLSQSD